MVSLLLRKSFAARIAMISTTKQRIQVRAAGFASCQCCTTKGIHRNGTIKQRNAAAGLSCAMMTTSQIWQTTRPSKLIPIVQLAIVSISRKWRAKFRLLQPPRVFRLHKFPPQPAGSTPSVAISQSPRQLLLSAVCFLPSPSPPPSAFRLPPLEFRRSPFPAARSLTKAPHVFGRRRFGGAG